MWLKSILCAIGGGVIGYAVAPINSPQFWIGMVGMFIVIISQNIE